MRDAESFSQRLTAAAFATLTVLSIAGIVALDVTVSVWRLMDVAPDQAPSPLPAPVPPAPDPAPTPPPPAPEPVPAPLPEPGDPNTCTTMPGGLRVCDSLAGD